MRRDAAVLSALLLAALAGCGGGDADVPPADPAAGPAAELGTEGERAPVRIAGVLVVGENTLEFQPCDGGAPLWLDGPLTPDVVDLHGQLTPGVDPFEGIFLDVVGDRAPPPAVGPGTGYEGALIVRELRRAAFEGWSCDDGDAGVVAAASGTEPFWSLRVTEVAAEFTTPEGRTALDLGELREDAEGWLMQGVDENGANVFLALSDFSCRDAMSGAYSHLTAELELGGRSYRGCAWLGPRSDPDAAGGG